MKQPFVQRDDRGSSIIEFTVLATFLMVPLVYVILTVFTVQAASYGVAQAAREAGRAYVSAQDDGTGWSRATAAASVALADHDAGFVLRDGDLSIVRCSASPCLTPGESITFQVSYVVSLPFVPQRILGVRPAAIPVRSTHVEVVDRFRVS